MEEHSLDAAFEDFFVRSRDPLFRSLLVAVRDRSLAEDALSEAFTRAYESWSVISTHPTPVAWVAKTALNWVRSAHRRGRVVEGIDGVDVGRMDDTPIDPDLVAAVLRLPRRQREVVAISVLLDLPTDETASILGIAPGTVTAHLHRALSRLENDLANTLPEEAQR